MGIALYTYGNPESEAWGLRLANAVSRWLREAFDVPPTLQAPAGPHFVYGDGPDLFLGRPGRGALHVVWDTNLLIDYFQHGRALWERESLLATGLAHADELEALQMIIGLWVLRDIRFHILPGVLQDAKHQMSDVQVANRERALDEFASALMVVEAGEAELDAPARKGLLLPPESELQRVLAQAPSGADRSLIEESMRVGAHVFLTRDRRVLASGPWLRPLGLLVASPGDLLTELVACGAFHCLWAPEFAYWPLPDQARVTHLVRALPDDRPA